MSALIAEVFAREILDSRGNPTVEAVCVLDDGTRASAAVPSGASTGKHEALELRDHEPERYRGKGVLKAVENVNTIISKEIVGVNVLDQKLIDSIMIELDGTNNKSKLGANAILSVSMAVAKAGARYLGIPLYRYLGGLHALTMPLPYFNVLNGGAHAPNNVDIQEFMIIPQKYEFKENLRIGSEVYHYLKDILIEKGLSATVGDEGGFAPDLKSNEEAIELLLSAIEKAGYKPGEDVYIGLDCAANSFYVDNKYNLSLDGKLLETDELIDLYEEWVSKYPIFSIEDALAEDDVEGWQKITEQLADIVQLVGDDIFVTNMERFVEGVEKGIANAILIKLNQIGTVTETFQVLGIAKEAGYRTVVSHRSGETEDTFISHLAVGVNANGIKAGAPARGERVAKYNELLRIEEEV